MPSKAKALVRSFRPADPQTSLPADLREIVSGSGPCADSEYLPDAESAANIPLLKAGGAIIRVQFLQQ